MTDPSTSPPANLFEDALRNLDEAFSYAEIHPEALERLRHPRTSIEVSIPVRMDSGKPLSPRDQLFDYEFGYWGHHGVAQEEAGHAD